MKILIVDDSKVMRAIVKRTLRQAGLGAAETEEAVNGVDALAKLTDFGPDLVLCDWNMPEMNGIELLEQLRADGNQVPFGFVTSEGSDGMRSRAASAGAAFLIAKPFTADQFEQHIRGAVAA